MSDATLKVGDKVQWRSQAGGYTKTKTGEIAVVVPAGERPTCVKEAGMPRDHESYVVRVGRTYYWPRASGLSKVDTGPSPDVLLRKIAEHAYDGQNGSCMYAFDRLARICDLCDVWIKAQGGEARRAETGTGSVHEHPVAWRCAMKEFPPL